MAQYSYIAKDKMDKVYRGNMDARNEKELRDKLKGKGLYVTSVNRKKIFFGFGSKKVVPEDLVVFMRQFSTLISAGIPIIKCLNALEKQTDKVVLKTVINDVKLNIEGGASLSEALRAHPSVFSEFFIALIEAAETAGILDKVLLRLANHMEKQDNLKRSVKGAFAYPIVVGSLAMLVINFLVIVIVPIFHDIYTRLNLSLPGPTLALIALSNFIRSFWWIILFLLVAVVFSYRWMEKNPFLRRSIDKIKINMPLFGKLIKTTAVARFIRTFGDMISSGIAVLESLKVADKGADNKAVSEVVQMMTDNVQRGGFLSEALEKQNIFPAMVVQMIASGEESGELDFMLEKAAEGLERDIDDTVKRLVVKIEPFMTFLMALLVGFIAIAIYLPIFDVIAKITVE